MVKLLSICFFAAAVPALAAIDSGGSAAVGGMTHQASIGSLLQGPPAESELLAAKAIS